MEWTGKTVFVTGGARGIGRAVVAAFGACGARVVFCDRDSEAGRRTAAETGARFVACDVRDAAALEAAMRIAAEQDGGVDIVVNNVGIGGFKPLEQASAEDFMEVIRTNLLPVFVTSRLLMEMRGGERRRYGRIISIASTRYLQSEPGSEGYAASKGGIVSLTHALALSFSEYNVTVNCISPGWIDNGTFGTISEADHRQHPSGRVGEPEDIARVCLFLADEANDFINGENIVVDGGMTRKMIYAE